MVAKTFKDYAIVSEVYEDGKNKYVKVQHPRTGKVRQVRWYTKQEYLKKYPEDAAEIGDPYDRKHMLGFDEGYITIFKGNITPHADWFSLSNARYHNTWGWYVVSTEEVPENLPDGIVPIVLSWEDVTENGTLRPQADIKKIVNKLKFGK